MSRPANRIALGLWFGLLLLSAACDKAPTSDSPAPTLTPYPADVYVGLSDSAAPVAVLVEAAYEDATGQALPVFLSGNDEALLNDLQQGLLEAVIIYHLPSDSQFWYSPVALDGVVIIVDPDLVVENMTTSQLQATLGGSIMNWVGLGGPDLAVSLLDREPGSGARAVLQQRIMGNADFSPSARIAASDDFMRHEIMATPGAIGYAMMASADGESISIDGIAATRETVADQSYPVTTPLYFVSLTEPTGPLRQFLAWLQSTDGQSVLGEKYGQVR